MDFAYSEKINAFRKQLNDFMDLYIYPNEQMYREQITASGDPHHHAEIIDELKIKASSLSRSLSTSRPSSLPDAGHHGSSAHRPRRGHLSGRV